MRAHLGIDGGGSSLRARAWNDQGEVVFDRRGGPGSWTQTPPEVLRQRLEDLLAGAPPVEAAFAALAGILTPDDRAGAATLLASLLPGAKAGAGADYEAVLAASDPSSLAVLIAGTGSLVCSHSQEGIHKTSGGGPLLGDPGSVYTLCRGLMSLMFRRPSEWPAEAWSHLLGLFDSSTPAEALARFYQADDRAQRACGLIGIIRDRYGSDERVSLLVQREMASLAQLIADHLAEMKDPPSGSLIQATGGLWRALPPSFSLLQSQLPPGLELQILPAEPVEGAILLARSLAQSQT